MPRAARPPFDAVVLRGRDLAVIRLAGELDCATAPELAAAVADALGERPSTLLVDLRGLTFVDPAGARPLRALAHGSEAGTRLRLRAVGTVRRVLVLLGLAAHLEG